MAFFQVPLLTSWCLRIILRTWAERTTGSRPSSTGQVLHYPACLLTRASITPGSVTQQNVSRVEEPLVTGTPPCPTRSTGRGSPSVPLLTTGSIHTNLGSRRWGPRGSLRRSSPTFLTVLALLLTWWGWPCSTTQHTGVLQRDRGREWLLLHPPPRLTLVPHRLVYDCKLFVVWEGMCFAFVFMMLFHVESLYWTVMGLCRVGSAVLRWGAPVLTVVVAAWLSHHSPLAPTRYQKLL